MNNKEILPKILNVVSNTISSELSSVTPKSKEDILSERLEAITALLESKLEDDEYISYGISLDTGKQTCRIEKKPLKIDRSKPIILSDEDLLIIKSHNIPEDFLTNEHFVCGISDRNDDVLIIRTDEISWKSLHGREWYYNINTKEFNLIKLS